MKYVVLIMLSILLYSSPAYSVEWPDSAPSYLEEVTIHDYRKEYHYHVKAWRQNGQIWAEIDMDISTSSFLMPIDLYMRLFAFQDGQEYELYSERENPFAQNDYEFLSRKIYRLYFNLIYVLI